MEVKTPNFKKVVTHSTIFHADDVFGVAMWKLINPDIKVVRTLHLEPYEDDPEVIIFDIGLGTYDHHQPDKALRPDGTPYCGFGLLWRDYGYLLCPEKEAWQKVDETLVLAIDKADNGVSKNTLSTAISAFNPNWNSTESEDGAFNRAVIIAMEILRAVVRRANAAFAAKEQVLANYFGGEVLTLDRYLPWQDAVLTEERLKDVLFVVYPSKRGGWNVQTVPKVAGQYVNRMDFPKDWLGHADPDRGIHFAHTANFLIGCDTLEQAQKVAEEAVEAGKLEATVAYSC